MNNLKGIFLTLLFLLSNVAYSDGWSGYQEIEKLNVGGNGLHGTFLKLKNYSFTGCTSSNAFWSPDTNPNYQEMLSVFLAAFMSGKKVSVNTSGCGGNGNHYPLIVEMQIE